MLNPRAANSAGDAGQHAGLVLDQHRERVRWLIDRCLARRRRPGATSRAAMMSSLLAPAATIGHTCASVPTTKSMTTGAVVDRHRLLDRRVDLVRGLAAQADAAQASASFTKSGCGACACRGRCWRVALVVEQLLPLPDHAEVAVVDDGDLDRDALDRAGGELLVGHLEAAVAVDRPHRACPGSPPWRPSPPARRSPSCPRPPELSHVPRLLVRRELRRPHLVLADAGDEDRVRAGDRAEPLDARTAASSVPSVGPVVAERVASRASRRAAPTRPSGRACRRPRPRPATARRSARRSPPCSRRRSARRRARFLPISAGSMSTWMIFASGANAVELAGDPVVEPGAERDQQVGLLQRGDRGDVAVHAGHAQVLRVAVRERAARHQRGDDRDAGQLGELPQLRRGAAP